MFAGLKNKIREETGSDVVIKVNPPIGGSRRSLRGRHSRTGSTTSLNSIMSTDGVASLVGSSSIRDEYNASPSSVASKNIVDDDEVQKIIAKKDAEFDKLLKDKENEWRNQLEEKSREKEIAVKEKEELDKRLYDLEELLKITEDQKRKLAIYRDEREQLENLQTQEISKVKHLLLQREKELGEKSSALKENTELVEQLRQQVSRLRRSEEELSCVQENTDEEKLELKERLQAAELRGDNLQSENARNSAALDLEKTRTETLSKQLEQIRNDFETERDKCKELCSSYDKERNDKDATLLRNAQVSQEVEIARQRIINQDQEISELSSRLSDLERGMFDKESQLSKTESEITTLKETVTKLEENVLDRDKNIKILQQRLAIMKKTLQRELRTNDIDSENLHDVQLNSSAVLPPTSQTTKYVTGNSNNNSNDVTTGGGSGTNKDDDDINFKYLKHVIITFLTSREYEAKQLTRAVATVLKFSPEEERLLRETLEWKMSWFGSRPKIGNGLAKAIPPS